MLRKMKDFQKTKSVYELIENLANKRVCIVGNAPEISPPEIPVDEHDVVFRFNNFKTGGEWGVKITHYCTTFRKEGCMPFKDYVPEDVQVLETCSRPRTSGGVSLAGIGYVLGRRLGCWPSSGLMACYLACLSGASLVTLVGMTLAPSLRREVKWGARYAPPWFYHNWIGERRVLSDLLNITSTQVVLPPILESLRNPIKSEGLDGWKEIARRMEYGLAIGGGCGIRSFEKALLALREIKKDLAEFSPNIEGVRLLEPFLFLPRKREDHGRRWHLFHFEGAWLVDEISAQLRRLQVVWPVVSQDGSVGQA